MATRLNILCDGMQTLNGQAFCFPILKHRKLLREEQINVTLCTSMNPGFEDGDVLAIDRKYCSNIKDWGDKETANTISCLRKLGRPIIFFDDSDSSGRIWNLTLENSDLYVKSQLLADHEFYSQSLYDEVAFADYYWRHLSCPDPHEKPQQQVPVPGHLKKLAVGWNSGLSDHSPKGRKRLRKAAFALRHLSARVAANLLSAPEALAAPDTDRPVALHSRMKMNYSPRSFGIQRALVAQQLGSRIEMEKLGRKRYFRELRNTWAVLSPFGYGEITLKDFEAFLCGNVLIKPDMSHMETWPPLYEAWETYVPVKWDLSDLDAILEDVHKNRQRYLPIAAAGQKRYLRYLSGDDAGEAFASHFAALVERVLSDHRTGSA